MWNSSGLWFRSHHECDWIVWLTLPLKLSEWSLQRKRMAPMNAAQEQRVLIAIQIWYERVRFISLPLRLPRTHCVPLFGACSKNQIDTAPVWWRNPSEFVCWTAMRCACVCLMIGICAYTKFMRPAAFSVLIVCAQTRNEFGLTTIGTHTIVKSTTPANRSICVLQENDYTQTNQ